MTAARSRSAPKPSPPRKPARATPKSAAGLDRATRPEPETGTWVLQAEAAARTGYSVSAIRKWRRAGVIADRKKVTPTGVERVEVRLEDVQARVALQPPAARPSPAPADQDVGPPPGTVIVLLTDLESLFGRVTDAERRAELVESRLKESQAETRYLSGQLADLRRQVQAASIPGAVGGTVGHREEPGLRAATAAGGGRSPGSASPPVPDRPPDRGGPEPRPFELVTMELSPRNGVVPVPPPARTPQATPPTPHRPVSPHPVSPVGPPPAARQPEETRLPETRLPETRLPETRLPETRLPETRLPETRLPETRLPETRLPETRPPDDRGAARPRPATPRRPAATAPPHAPTPATKLDALALELRRLYARLDDYRREPTISPARERQRERYLGEYDTVLLRACAALSIPAGLRAGEPVTVERRGALTQALAKAGLDVRSG